MPESNEPLPSPQALQRQIDEAKSHAGMDQHDTISGNGGAGMGQGMQAAGEFIAGAGIGSVCGYFLDRSLQTSPIFLVIGFVLGFAAGVYGMIRRAKNTNR
jgi:F0F1-type ATP synthase assembly protein I